MAGVVGAKRFSCGGEESSRVGGEEGAAATAEVAAHPYHFLVSGPRNFSTPNWRELISSSWRDPNYRRTAMACFVQAAYLLELDRQEKRTAATALAPCWWKPFHYKLTQTLHDARDGSIYGAILEWDRAAAMTDLVLARPRGAPKAILALRGTLLRSATARRDLQDDLRFLAVESLKGSVRFAGALAAARSAVGRFGGGDVCVAGHSLGAGFALQVGKALAKEGAFVDCHLFNPPSVSLAGSVKVAGEKASYILRKVKAAAAPAAEEAKTPGADAKRSAEAGKRPWVPNLYINSSDYICCCYCAAGSEKTKAGDGGAVAAAKLFVASNGPRKFLEAHGLQQWWSDDMELDLAIDRCKLIERQLRSLYGTSQPHPH